MEKANVSVILPSYNPCEKLLDAVRGLISAGFDDIIIVDDGSREERQHFFAEAEVLDEVTIVHHDVNHGKGRALKTGYEFFLKNRPDRAGVVTTDDDGQHAPEDVMSCALRMEQCGDAVFGARDFSLPDVPPKSRFGNKMTSFVFRVFCGIKITDTQTGLRAFPRDYLKLMCEVGGERFEYETNVLLEMHREGLTFEELPIRTIYINSNNETHFNPLKDSLKIYAAIFKFMLSSGLSSIIDIVMFTLLNLLLPASMDGKLRVFIATFGARVVSSLFNFFANKTRVFKNSGSIKSTMAKYYALCVVQTGLSYLLVFLLSMAISAEHSFVQSLIKIVVDVVLFFLSFGIQRDWVFAKSGSAK